MTELAGLLDLIDEGTLPEAAPAWARAVADAVAAEQAFELALAEAALVRAREGAPAFAAAAIALVEHRVRVRAATPAGLAAGLAALGALVADPATIGAVRARANHALAVANLRTGDVAAAEAAITAAIGESDGLGIATIWMMDTLAQVLVAEGAWLEAIATLEMLVVRRRARGDGLGVAISGGHLARLQLQLGSPAAAAALAEELLVALPADAAALSRLRIATIALDAALELGTEPAAADAALAELVAECERAGNRHYLVGWALLSRAQVRARAGDADGARALLSRAANHALPPPVILQSEAMIDPARLRDPAWLGVWATVSTAAHVTEAEIRTHLLVAADGDAASRRRALDLAHARAVRSNNAMWLRWVDEAIAHFDPAVHVECVAERFTGRAREDLARTSREDATIVFADLVGFTPRALELAPEEVMRTVRSLFELGVPLFAHHQVRPLSYLGDGLLAIAQGDHHRARGLAFACALVGRAGRVSRLRERLATGGPLHMRAGVASGLVVLGTLGSLFKTDFAAVGVPTNLAARLQGIAAPGQVVCTAEVAAAAGRTVPVELAQLKGFERSGFVRVCRMAIYAPT